MSICKDKFCIDPPISFQPCPKMFNVDNADVIHNKSVNTTDDERYQDLVERIKVLETVAGTFILAVIGYGAYKLKTVYFN